MGVADVRPGLERGLALRSEFALPGISLPIELRAVVRWTSDDGSRAGLHFLELDPGIAELLENFLAGRLTR